jgi:glycosyltransferase involved in cell wall biosynthesis
VRILVLQESDWVERGPHQSHHLLERIALRGHEVRVVDFEIGWATRRVRERVVSRRVFQTAGKIFDRVSITVVRPGFVRLPLLDYLSSTLTHALEIRRQMREFRPDVVVALGILNTFAGIRISVRSHVPTVYYLIDSLHRLVPQRLFRGFSKVLEEANLKRATRVLLINEQLKDYAIKLGAPPERSEVLPAGIDLKRYDTADGREVRRRFGIGDSAVVLFFMGWVYPFSGIREVGETILQRGTSVAPEIRLLVIGKGPAWSELESLHSARENGDRIVALGWQPFSETPRFLAAADICILPATSDEIMQDIVPIKMYEYMAAAKPVIVTRLPGLVREFGEDHGVVYVDDPQDVVPKALELHRKGAIEELGRKARAFVQANDWNEITDRFEAELQQLAAHRAEVAVS